MAEKISTLILKVDLDCELCYKKIRKVLCKLQDEQKIKTISYDEKNKTVTISGPFDTEKLSKKLYSKAGKVIKDIQIKDNKEKEKGKEKEKEKDKDKEKDKPKDKPPESAAKEKPKEAKKEDKPSQKAAESDAKPKQAEKDQAKENPTTSKVESAPQMAYPPAGSIGPACCFRPFYEGYYGGFRCCSCGRTYGWTGANPMGFYGGGPWDGPKNYQFFCEEDPSTSCRIM